MSETFDDRVLALAGLAQALAQVRRMAETGHADPQVVRAAIDSVFRLDADTAADVYGGARELRSGLKLLQETVASRGGDPLLPRLGLAIIKLERQLDADAGMGDALQRGIAELAPQHAAEPGHPQVLEGLGALYSDTLSHLRPRVMVQGNPHYLGQNGVVTEIRALLLAAVRSAVLWRQMDGSLWDFLLRRRRLAEATARWLG